MNPTWSLVYEKAIRDDGSLLFPERLTKEFLENARRTMGSYLFANQYQNETIPSGDQTFKKHWNRYYAEIPPGCLTFAFLDPAISEADTADYTALVVVAVDTQRNWYVRHASRQRINPTEIIDLLFTTQARYKCQSIGVEDVAFQRAIIHFTSEEMRKRGTMLPITGVKRGPDMTKEMRILSLVPRFEWGSIFLNQGLHDLELELAQFPRGAHDDIVDGLSSLESIIHYPTERVNPNERPASNSPHYEGWFIQNLAKRRAEAEY